MAAIHPTAPLLVCLLKGTERYIYLYDSGREADIVQRILAHADDERLSLTWHDAGLLCGRVDQMAKIPPAGRSR